MSEQGVFRGRFVLGKIPVPGYPPPPTPSECLDWRGVCKNGLQNLERLGLRGQNLESKGLTAFFVVGAYTASALTMICFLSFGVKVLCHKGPVEFHDVRLESIAELTLEFSRAHCCRVREKSPLLAKNARNGAPGNGKKDQNPHPRLKRGP